MPGIFIRVIITGPAEGLCIAMAAAIAPDFKDTAFNTEYLTAAVTGDGRRAPPAFLAHLPINQDHNVMRILFGQQ